MNKFIIVAALVAVFGAAVLAQDMSLSINEKGELVDETGKAVDADFAEDAEISNLKQIVKLLNQLESVDDKIREWPERDNLLGMVAEWVRENYPSSLVTPPMNA